MAMLPLLLVSCHKDEDDLFSTALIMLDAGEGFTVERMQGTLRLTNLNTRQVVSTADFEGNIARLQVLRGAYSALVEGSVQIKTAEGRSEVRQFRATADYMALDKEDINTATLQMIWMQ